jgi:hypothetical protein
LLQVAQPDSSGFAVSTRRLIVGRVAHHDMHLMRSTIEDRKDIALDTFAIHLN